MKMKQNKQKTVITFGSDHLPWLKENANNIALIINKPEQEARSDVFRSAIGPYFSTSYNYDNYINNFKKYNMKEYTLKQCVAGSEKYKDNNGEDYD